MLKSRYQKFIQSKLLFMVNFYILSQNDILNALNTICRIIEKAFEQKNTIFVYSPNEYITNDLDQMLWTFKESSFIAHTTLEEQIQYSPVYINHVIKSIDPFSIIINLTPKTITPTNTINKIIEFVYNDKAQKQLSREKYLFYKNNNLNLTTYKI